MEIDNRERLLGEELRPYLTKGAKVHMAAATFSMFAYKLWDKLVSKFVCEL